MAQLAIKKKTNEEQDPQDPNVGLMGKRILPQNVTDAPIGKPIMPGPSLVADAAPPPEPQPSAGASPSLSLGPQISPVNPDIAMTQTRLSGLLQQGEPVYHGGRKILDTIAGATKIGTNIERASGLGTEGYKAKKADAEHDLASAMGVEKENQGIQSAQSLETERQVGDELVDVTDANGHKFQIMRKNLASPASAIINSGSKNDTNKLKFLEQGLDENGDPVPDEQLPPTVKSKVMLDRAHTDLMKQQAALAQMRANPNSPIYQRQLQTMQLAQKNYDLRRQEFGFQYDPSVLTPTQQQSNALPHGQGGEPIPLKSPEAPTAATRNAGQAAGMVESQVPRILQEIDVNASKLGPFSGRFEDAYVSKFGANDPEYAKMDTDLSLLSSGSARAHLGVRGAAAVTGAAKEWRDSLRTAQTVDDLKARISSIDHWMEGYARAGGAAPANQSGGKERPVIKLVP